MSPERLLPGEIHRPGLAAWNVAVAFARTAAPSDSPVEASTPLGTSHAITVAPPSAAALIASIAPAAGSRGSPENPVPRIASTIPAACCSAASVNGSGGGPGSRSKLTRASPCSSPGSASSSTRTSRPRWRRTRAATSPSPPLLPLPQTTAIGPAGTSPPARSASPEPASSIRSSPGIPSCSIAHVSSARCCCASGSGSSQPGRLMRRPAPRSRPPRHRCRCG